MMVAIFYLSSLSDAPIPGDMSDKSGHVLGYTALGASFVRALAGGLGRRVTLRAAWLGIAMTVGYGVTDEVHQSFVPGRSPEGADMLADAAGAMLGAVGCWAWGILLPRLPHPRDLP